MTASKLIWEEDLEKSSEKYHIYGAWIAIIFDPVFGITDYFNIPHAFNQIMSLRIGVSIIAALALLAHRRKFINSKMLIFIPFLLISIQNAYTFSVIEVDDFTGHSLNYLALFIGAGMFVLWNWYYSIAIIVPSVLATGYFFQMNHHHYPYYLD